MTKKSEDPLYAIKGAAMKVHSTLGKRKARGKYGQALLNKLRAVGYQATAAEPVKIYDDDGDYLTTLSPDIWLTEMKLLIRILVIRSEMNASHADEARDYLKFKPEAEQVLLLNFGMGILRSWPFSRSELEQGG